MTPTEMSGTEPEVIPTLSRAKISHHLSYPIGAERISQALKPSLQFRNLKLHFYAAMGTGLMESRSNGRNIYGFLRVEYLNNSETAEKYPIRRLYKRPPQYRWEIIVLPVPRVHRHTVNRNIIDFALPRVEDWLLQRSHQESFGSEVLAFYYDPETDAVSAEEVSHLEPER